MNQRRAWGDITRISHPGDAVGSVDVGGLRLGRRRLLGLAVGALATGTLGLVSACTPAAPSSEPAKPPAVAPTAAPAAAKAPTAAPAAAGAPAATTPAKPAAAAAKGSKTLNVGLVGKVLSLDPHKTGGLSMTAWINMYEPLFVLDHTLNRQPALALSHEWRDPTHLRVKLRQGVKFHNGTPWTAKEAVKWAQRMNDPKSPALDSRFYHDLKEAVALDDYTLEFVLGEPNAQFLNVISSNFLVWGPADLGDAHGNEPVGSGPFKFVEWKPDQYVRMARNEDWWGDPKPKIDSLVIRLFNEETTRVLALQKGEIDLSFNVHPAVLRVSESDKNIKSTRTDVTRNILLHFNVKHPITADPKVRRALSHGVDIDTMATKVAGLYAAKPMYSHVSPGFNGGIQVGWPEFDPAKGQQLLDEAGWMPGADGIRHKGGEQMMLRWVIPEQRDPFNKEVTLAIQEQWRKMGVATDLFFTDVATMQKMGTEPDPGAYVVVGPTGRGGLDVFLDVDEYSSAQASPKTSGGTTRYSHPDLDKLLSAYKAESDQAKQLASLAEIQKHLYAAVPGVPLYQATRNVSHSAAVTEFADHPLEWYPHRYVTTDTQAR